jgi:hypothetical protein
MPHDHMLACIDGWHFRFDRPWSDWERWKARWGWIPGNRINDEATRNGRKNPKDVARSLIGNVKD